MTPIYLIFIYGIIIIIANLYTFKHGIAMWKYEHNKLGSIGTIIIAILSTILPIAYLVIRVSLG